jgi:hypothetical protein
VTTLESVQEFCKQACDVLLPDTYQCGGFGPANLSVIGRKRHERASFTVLMTSA